MTKLIPLFMIGIMALFVVPVNALESSPVTDNSPATDDNGVVGALPAEKSRLERIPVLSDLVDALRAVIMNIQGSISRLWNNLFPPPPPPPPPPPCPSSPLPIPIPAPGTPPEVVQQMRGMPANSFNPEGVVLRVLQDRNLPTARLQEVTTRVITWEPKPFGPIITLGDLMDTAAFVVEQLRDSGFQFNC